MKKKPYHSNWPLLAAAYHHAGLSRDAIAEHLGVSRARFDALARRHPELERAAGGALDDPVEAALLRRAVGFSQSETVREDLVDKKTGEVLESCKCRTVIKEVPPDVRALLFWLKNRRPERWQERSRNGDDDFEFTPDETEQEL